MSEQERRDRDGEIFEDDLTDNTGASPAAREAADHDDGLPTEQDDQSGDDFMRQQFEKK